MLFTGKPKETTGQPGRRPDSRSQPLRGPPPAGAAAGRWPRRAAAAPRPSGPARGGRSRSAPPAGARSGGWVGEGEGNGGVEPGMGPKGSRLQAGASWRATIVAQIY